MIPVSIRAVSIPRAWTVCVRAVLVVAAVVLAACAQAPIQPIAGPVFYPPPPATPRIQYLTTVSSEKDIGGGRRGLAQFVAGTPETVRIIMRPHDIDHYGDKLYVVDRQAAAVHVLDLANKRFGRLNMGRAGPFQQPGGIFITPDGYKFVADKDREQILMFDPQDQFQRTYGEPGQFAPTDVVVVGDRLYVCDIRDEEIEILDRASGRVIKTFGGRGADPGQFRFPSHLTTDAAGDIFVTDFMNFRVQVFDGDGSFIRTFGQMGDGPGDMPRPKGIAVDRDDHLYVVDAGFELVQIFDADTGRALMGFGKYGNQPGGTYLPQGVHIDYDNLSYFAEYLDAEFDPEYLVYVANQSGNDKINVYAFGKLRGTGS